MHVLGLRDDVEPVTRLAPLQTAGCAAVLTWASGELRGPSSGEKSRLENSPESNPALFGPCLSSTLYWTG